MGLHYQLDVQRFNI